MSADAFDTHHCRNVTPTTDLDASLIAEFRSFIANAMLSRIACFSAELYFQSVARDLAVYLAITPEEACDLLLVTSRAIYTAGEHEARKQIRVQVVRDAA